MPIGASDRSHPGTLHVKPMPEAAAANYAFDPVPCRCPLCGEIPDRIRRRAIDRALSVFVSVHRYRCFNPLCAWEGNYRSPSKPSPRPTHSGLASLIGQIRRWQVLSR